MFRWYFCPETVGDFRNLDGEKLGPINTAQKIEEEGNGSKEKKQRREKKMGE